MGSMFQRMSRYALSGKTLYDFPPMAGKDIQATLLPPDFAVRSKELRFNVLLYAGDIVDMPMGGLGTTDKRLKEKRDKYGAYCGRS
jgi:hypothetical protein